MSETPEDKAAENAGQLPPRDRATTVSGGTRIIGTYEIDQLISAGGMGEVYRGHNIHNGEPVAIKIVLPALAHDPKIVALFQKESTTLSRLSHEAIVRYHVFTNDPGIGRPCLVMEFVAGTPLSERIEAGPMPVDQVRVMLRRVALGLDKAHRAGVVHRDMSPDNIILEEGQVEHAKLIDFGIAKSSAIGAGTLLQGQFAGKFNWVAPEQLGAFGGHVDGRSDIYSLALVVAAASKGAVLPMGSSIVDAVSKRAQRPDLTGVDATLVPLLGWMLSPDPAARPETMAQVIAALDDPALVPVAQPHPDATVIGAVLPLATDHASPFANAPLPPPVAAPTAAALPAAKRSILLPLAVVVMLATSAVAYFSGTFAPKPAAIPQSAAASAPEATVTQTPVPEVLTAAALQAALGPLAECGPLMLGDPPSAGYGAADRVRISGLVASKAAEAALSAKLAPLLGNRALVLTLEQRNPAICAVLNGLTGLPAAGTAIALGFGDRSDANPDGRYRSGENPVIDLTLPAAGLTWVALVNGSGQVLQLVQGQSAEGKLRVAFPVAETAPGKPAVIVNPAGLGLAMIVVLRTAPTATVAPFKPGPSLEPVQDFVQRMKALPLVSMDQRMLSLTDN